MDIGYLNHQPIVFSLLFVPMLQLSVLEKAPWIISAKVVKFIL